MENEFLLQILKFQFIAQSHMLMEHVKRNLKNSSFCLPVYLNFKGLKEGNSNRGHFICTSL